MYNCIKVNIFNTEYETQSHFDNMKSLLDKHGRSIAADTLLDVGCNKGTRSIAAANILGIAHHNVHGVDIEDISNDSPLLRNNFKKIDLEDGLLPYDDNSFGLVICNQVMEHLKNYNRIFQEIIRVTKRDGFIVLGIPNLAHLMNRILLLFGTQPMCMIMRSGHVRGFTHKAFLEFLHSQSPVKLINCKGSSIIYPLPYVLAQPLSNIFTGLCAYTCYLIQKNSDHD